MVLQMTKPNISRPRAREKTEIIYGVHPVVEALRANRRRFRAIYVSVASVGKAPKWLHELSALAESLEIPVDNVSPARLDSLADTDSHQGVAAKVEPYPLQGIADLVGRKSPVPSIRFFVLLDHVVDPHNFGALVRTAHCAGAQGIIVPKDRSAPPTATVSKVSAGALEHVHMVRVTNMVNTIKVLKEEGIWIVGLDREADESIFTFEFPPSVAIIIGGEQKGIRPLVKKQCDFLCAIPQMGRIDSLNASVAGGIAMYEIYRQHEASKGY
jgi:23S rRNA (guanosine2251-2'-O)-methyltransferase